MWLNEVWTPAENARGGSIGDVSVKPSTRSMRLISPPSLFSRACRRRAYDRPMPTVRDVPATRRRLTLSLVGTVGLGSTGNIAAVSVGTIAAAELAGTTALSGAPGAMVVLGSAAGSYLLSSLMVRRGRRTGLATGYALGVIGALLAVAAVTTHGLPLLFLGTALIGFGSSSNQLSRYAAADMYPSSRRGSAIAT